MFFINKRNEIILYSHLQHNADYVAIFEEVLSMRKKLALIVLTIIMIVSFSSCTNTKKTSEPDPDRKTESCTYLGTAKVLDSEHLSRYDCVRDGDGWYYPTLGHHHHK